MQKVLYICRVKCKSAKIMKKFWISLLVIVIIGGVAVVTCPDKDAHKDAIQAVLNEKMADKLGVSDQNSEGVNGILNGIATVGSHVNNWLLDSNLTVKNNFIYSVGYLNANGEKEKVSFGIFGHVFTFDKDDLDKTLSKTL